MTDRHVDPERPQFEAFKALPRDTPIHMLHLVRFKDKAAYALYHPFAELDMSGADAYAMYGKESGPVFRRVGGRIVWRATTADQWQGAQDVGNVTEARVKLSKDNYFFGVQAIDRDGNVSVATYPMPLR